METRADGMLIYDDQLMEMAERILRAEGLRDTYQRKKNHSWIGKTEDEGLDAGLEELTEVQIRIIELIYFEGMCPADVRRVIEMSLKEIRIEIRSIRKTLSKVM